MFNRLEMLTCSTVSTQIFRSHRFESLTIGEIEPRPAISIMENILDLIDNCKYLAAYDEYKQFTEKLSEEHHLSPEDKMVITDQISAHQEVIDMMLERAKKIQETLDYEDNEAWTLGANYFGITTHYRKCPEDDSIFLKMEGVMEESPLFETLAVLHEIDLYKDWVPFCGESKLIHKISVADVMGYVNMGFPLFSRDTLVRAYGADLLASHGKIIMLGNSILDYKGEHHIPFKKIGYCHNRVDCKEFQFVIDLLSPTKAKTSIMAHVNLNTKLPQTLINFLMKNLAGILLSLFNRQVVHVSKHPNCSHAERIRSNKEFYSRWVLPRFRTFCDLKGWPQATISSLGEDGIPPLTSCSGKESSGDDITPSTSERSEASTTLDSVNVIVA